MSFVYFKLPFSNVCLDHDRFHLPGCSHLPVIPLETSCDEQNGDIVTKRTAFVLIGDACVNQTETFREKVGKHMC